MGVRQLLHSEHSLDTVLAYRTNKPTKMQLIKFMLPLLLVASCSAFSFSAFLHRDAKAEDALEPKPEEVAEEVNEEADEEDEEAVDDEDDDEEEDEEEDDEEDEDDEEEDEQEEELQSA